MKKLGAVLHAVLAAAFLSSGAAGESRPGAMFLVVPLSVRQMGRGDVAVGSGDVLSAWSNPALLADLEVSGEVALKGGAHYDMAGTTGGIGGAWAFTPTFLTGAMASYYSAGTDRIDEYGNNTGEKLAYDGIAAGAAAAMKIRYVSLGITLKAVSENLLGDRASGAAADIGAGVAWNNLSAGVAVRNVGPSLRRAEGTGGFAESLPLESRMGLAYAHESWNASAGMEYSLVPGCGGSLGIGVEYWPAGYFGIRTGLADIGGGGNLRFTAGLSGNLKGIGLDYAINTHTLGLVHVVCVSYAFGLPGSSATARRTGPSPFAGRLQEGKLNIAVAEFEARGASTSDAASVGDMLRRALVQQKSFTVVEKKHMDKLVAEQVFQDTGCTTDECAVEMGKLLNVQAMVMGSFGRLAGRYVVEIRTVDVQTGKVVHADSVTSRNVDGVRRGLEAVAERMSRSLL